MDRQVEQLPSWSESIISKFDNESETHYIDEAINFDREILALFSPGHTKRSASLISLAVHLCTRYEQLGRMEDLNEAIILDRETLALHPPGHPDRSASLNWLAHHLWTRYKQHGSVEDLKEAIVLDRDALALCPQGHSDRPKSLNNLAIHLSSLYKQFGSMDDLHEAIALDQDALTLRPSGHPDRSASLHSLADHMWIRFNEFGSVEDLNEAIILAQDALVLRPPGHPDRSKSLNSLADHLWTRYSRRGSADDLNKAIVLVQDALALRPLGHPDRSKSLNSLAIFLSTRYTQLGSLDDLNEAIILDRGALALRPLGHPDRSMSLNSLSLHLCTRYSVLGSVQDLNEAVTLSQDALALRPPGHPDRPKSMNNLAMYLSARYKRLGSVEDLNEAIVLTRDVLARRPPGHPLRSTSLNNLAAYLYTRYKQLGSLDDLNEAIVLDRDALALCPPGNPGRSMPLGNLAVHLCTRHQELRSLEDLNEAIVLSRDVLALRPPGHPERSLALINLAAILYTRFEQLRSVDDLNEVIAIDRDTLEFCPPSDTYRQAFLNNFAGHLCTRYKELGSVEDLNEAIVLDRDTLALCPPGNPDRSQSLSSLAEHLSIRFTSLNQSEDKEELFNLFLQLAHAPPLVSSTDLSAVKKWIRIAEGFHHPTTPLAYKTSLRLLTHHLATLPSLPQHLTILKRLTSSLAVDAFSACIRDHSPADAVEFLEQGRGVFWSQLTRLHSPIDDVIASGPAGEALAAEFTRLTILIRKTLDSPGPDQHDRVCNLNVELQKVINEIRNLSGLERFLLPSLFSHLRQAASEGPVIVVNASEYGCDALIVLFDRDPVHIPLPITKEGVRELSSDLVTLTVQAKSRNIARSVGILLREVWEQVVSPVIEFLQTICPSRSRIWWCPTAEFSLLPLHAAGPYKRGQRNLAELYISSYTPTLTALIRARRHQLLSSPPKPKRFIAIGQAKATGESELFSVGTELSQIGQHIHGLAIFTHTEGQDSSVARVTRELHENEWVHLACHGIPNQKQPFKSAFALHDGQFTIEQIIRCEPEDPHFAYLSACHTTVGDEESPDEVIHLASAMHFVGFRSVIGTMWAVDDGWTNKITSMFYDNMKDESGCLDYTRAAFALNKTMGALVDVPFDQRILYIHLGA